MKKYIRVAALVVGLVATPAQAGEVFAGLYAHAVDTPFTLETEEEGVDIQFGGRTDPIEVLNLLGKPSAHVFGSINTTGDTNFIVAGFSWKIISGPVYIRPGVGLALHDAPDLRKNPVTGIRTDLGSRVLFVPEMALGTNVSPRVSLEVSWVHISNAQLFDDEQNPGIDAIGLRLNVKI